MHRLCIFVVCVGAFSYAASGHGQAGTNAMNPIGQNITVRVQAYYDDSFSHNNTQEKVKKHFDDIFSQIQKYLNLRQVMLNFTVENATLINNLTVHCGDNKTINGNATLDALKTFTQNTSSIDTINYFFTSTNVWENSTYRAEDVFTPNTFCTTNVTATVLQTLLHPLFYQTALKETIFMLGSRNTQRFTPEDFQKMNQTFWKCYENKTMEVN